ncbi:Carbon monoxide dehydrogenase medium chain [Carbonactinospora thermoautotrophica]|uniref:Carbon monoxide dehydrogenase medium chain n=1 Tax=Carbonactinospora thermoautotrophica TaxID=1469144 RepID=A0A132MTQ2_9ACTN|nr:xanthine dehydrogenase family protein subunit M [Carbonactinospora thermoautotrophica]KWX00752.1 Carbon monoxide dehydrogenase medium chain [Carbonactinospora thermoautotrophica]
MKPPPFTYHAPTTVGEALGVLAELGPEGKVLAGGQSLIPLLNMRLAVPPHLVDINRIPELAYVRVDAGGVRVGALARHAELERHAGAYQAVPLLRQALQLVAHPVIRNRGTTVGSIVHADPAAEMPAVLALLGGTVELARKDRRRTVGAADFFLGPLESCLEPGELALAVHFPRLPGRTGTAFVELARRHGDYALAGLAAAVTLDEDLRVAHARAAYVGVAPVPLVVDLTDAVRGVSAAGERSWTLAGRLAQSEVQPEADIHATAEYRRHLVGVLTARALHQAAQRALPEPGPDRTETTP